MAFGIYCSNGRMHNSPGKFTGQLKKATYIQIFTALLIVVDQINKPGDARLFLQGLNIVASLLVENNIQALRFFFRINP